MALGFSPPPPPLKFELTNQDSAGERTELSRLQLHVNRSSIESEQPFPLKLALNIHERELIFPKTISTALKEKRMKNMKTLVSPIL